MKAVEVKATKILLSDMDWAVWDEMTWSGYRTEDEFYDKAYMMKVIQECLEDSCSTFFPLNVVTDDGETVEVSETEAFKLLKAIGKLVKDAPEEGPVCVAPEDGYET